MPRLLLMSDIVLRCKRRADLEGQTVIGDPEWKALISEQYGQMYAIVVKSGMRYFESSATLTANGATSYALPSDHDETVGIDRTIDNSGRKVQLAEFMIQERNEWSGQTGDAMAYSLVAQTIVLFPRPTSGTYTHVYVPQSPDISALADASTVDVVTADGEAFLIYGVSTKAKAKLDADPRLDIAERDAAMGRFAEDVEMRALVNPRRRIVIPSPGAGGVSDRWDDDPGGWWQGR